MPTLADLRNAATTLLDLPALPAILQLNSPTRERAFEAYTLSLIVRAVRQAGNDSSATIVGIQSGPNPATVILRGGPGRLGSSAQNFAFVQCQLGNKSFEIHVDVQYAGGSGAIHEIDVSIYDHDSAQRIRQSSQAGNTFPPCSKLLGAVECKFYDVDLGTSLGRTFVGLVDDCGTLHFKAFATNGHHNGLAQYFALKKRPMRFFDLSPINTLVEADCVSWFATEFRKWAELV